TSEAFDRGTGVVVRLFLPARPTRPACPSVSQRFSSPLARGAAALGRRRPAVRNDVRGPDRPVRQTEHTQRPRPLLHALPALVGVAGRVAVHPQVCELAEDRAAGPEGVCFVRQPAGYLSRRIRGGAATAVADGRARRVPTQTSAGAEGQWSPLRLTCVGV